MAAGVAKLFDGHIVDKSGDEIDLSDGKYKGKVIGLYFSAHWCPPCRRCTPVLTEFYKKYHEDKDFEIIFVSADKNEESFNDYYKDMPWLALEYGERDKESELNNKYKVNGIPTLVLLDGDTGNVINADASDEVQEKKQWEHFPWNKNDNNDDE